MGKKSGKKTAVSEQSYGDTYMKTTVLTKDAIGDQMFADASGEKKMKIGKGASAGEKPADAVSDKPAGTTKPAATGDKAASGTTTKPAATGDKAATKTRVLQDANATKAANATAAPANTDWKKLKGEDEYMRVVVNEKMFAAGGPLANVTRPVIMFNKHGADYVKDFPRARRVPSIQPLVRRSTRLLPSLPSLPPLASTSPVLPLRKVMMSSKILWPNRSWNLSSLMVKPWTTSRSPASRRACSRSA